jgi:hypothetical protein
MSDHFYSVAATGQALQRKRSDIVVGTTSSQSAAGFATDKAAVATALAAVVAALAAEVAALAPVVAADAVLVADGASPTQAHVTTLDAAMTTLSTAQTTLNAAQTTLNAAMATWLADFVAGNPIELRITDAAVKGREGHGFCEFLAAMLEMRDAQVIPAGTILI